ncbi:MAG: TetR/AcrR family transcriptional regulator [Myxococcota bacterium]
MGNAATHKANLIQAAIRLFREKGYAATGLNEILAESGAPKGSLYHYFPGGKDQLGATAVTLAGQVVTRTLQEIDAATEGAEGFVAAYTELLGGWLEASGFRAGCPIATTLLETVPASEAITQAGQEAFSNWIAVVTKVLEDDGVSPSEARDHAELLIATVEGALLLARVQQSTKPLQALSRQLRSIR